MAANYNQYKNRNFTVLGVSLDRPTGREAWLNAIATDHLSWMQVSDLKFWQNEAAQRYGIQVIPQKILGGPDGRIVAKNVRGARQNAGCQAPHRSPLVHVSYAPSQPASAANSLPE